MATKTYVTTEYMKDVRRNHETRDWDAYVIVGGEEIYLGSEEHSWKAESLCDQYVYDALKRQPPAVVAAPYYCDDEVDTAQYGKEIGTTYRAGEGDVEVYVDHDADMPVTVYAFGVGGLKIEDVARDLPAVMAPLMDVRVQVARARVVA